MGRCKKIYSVDSNEKYNELQNYNDTLPKDERLSGIDLITRWRALRPEYKTFCCNHGLQEDGICSKCSEYVYDDPDDPFETDVDCCRNCIYYGEFSELVVPEDFDKWGFYNYANFLEERKLIRRCLNCEDFIEEKYYSQ